ncbi:MAG TPA: hypothetical protein VMW75_15630 [Thermoanaerobaculia bacterium]|nr:hypothetical protein [Thermoanaerobaculia bacterium]
MREFHLEVMQLLYEAAAGPCNPPADLSQRFSELLHKKLGLTDPSPHLPPVDQLENPLRHIADIARTCSYDTARQDDYFKALALGMDHLRHKSQPVDQDVLGMCLTCTRPAQAEQLVEAYNQNLQTVTGLRRLLTVHRLSKLLNRGIVSEDQQEAASCALLRWIARYFPETKGLGTLQQTLTTMRSSFLYDINEHSASHGVNRAPEVYFGRRRRPCSAALASGLLRLGTGITRVDPLLLRMIIHWRHWDASDQVVTAYGDLEQLSDFAFSAFLENLLYQVLKTAGVVQLRMPLELARVAVISAAQAATTFLRYEEPLNQPTGQVLRGWIDAAVAMVFHPPLLAIAHAQESLQPAGRQRGPGRPPTLKLLPFLRSHSNLSRHEKHLLLKNLVHLVTALGNLPSSWSDDVVADATQLLIQGVAYESLDYERDENTPPEPAQIRRLRHTLSRLEKVDAKLPWLPRHTVRNALVAEIALLKERIADLTLQLLTECGG